MILLCKLQWCNTDINVNLKLLKDYSFIPPPLRCQFKVSLVKIRTSIVLTLNSTCKKNSAKKIFKKTRAERGEKREKITKNWE